MSSEQFLGLCAVIIAAGGVVEVLRRWVFGPLIKGLRLIEKLVKDVADLLARMGEVEKSVDAMSRDVAEIKGALKATGILPDHDD